MNTPPHPSNSASRIIMFDHSGNPQVGSNVRCDGRAQVPQAPRHPVGSPPLVTDHSDPRTLEIWGRFMSRVAVRISPFQAIRRACPQTYLWRTGSVRSALGDKVPNAPNRPRLRAGGGSICDCAHRRSRRRFDVSCCSRTRPQGASGDSNRPLLVHSGGGRHVRSRDRWLSPRTRHGPIDVTPPFVPR